MMIPCIATEAFTWSEILWITLIGFLLVFMLLVLLIFVMILFGKVFTIKSKKTQTVSDVPAKKVSTPAMISSEEVAAIGVALKLYKGALHDQESEVLTILNIKRVYSPWNSKILSLTKLPDKK